MSEPAPEPLSWWQRPVGRVVVLGGAACVCAAIVYVGLQLDFTVPVSTVLKPAPVAVGPGIYLLGKLSPGTAYVVDTSAGLVLVDTGLEANAKTLLDQFNDLGLDPLRLKAILLTHGHADHSLGAGHLRAKTGAKIHAGRGDCDTLRKGEPREAFFSTFHMPNVSAHATTIDVELQGGESLAFGDSRFEVIAAPGHTPGSVCYLLHHRRLRVLFTGDVVQALNKATPSHLGTYSAYLPPLYGGNASDYLATLRTLRELPVPDLVLPGHPRMDKTPEGPKLTQAAWHELLDPGIAEMRTLIGRYDADGADYLDGIAKELLPGLHYLGDVEGRAVYCVVTAKDVVLFDAPGGPGFADLLQRRFADRGWRDRKVTAVFLTSADAAATSGLRPLVEKHNCKVVVGGLGMEAVRQVCPAGAEVVPADEFAKRGWLPGQALSLAGRGLAPVAYTWEWEKKLVLVSGRIPTKISVPSQERLRAEVRTPAAIAEYVRSLDELATLAPDLWLPAAPVHGQNANVYDRDWAKVLGENKQAFAW